MATVSPSAVALIAAWTLVYALGWGGYYIYTHGFTAWALTVIVIAFVCVLFWLQYLSPEARLARRAQAQVRADQRQARSQEKARKDLGHE